MSESQEKLAAALGGILTGALIEAFGAMANQLRQYTGRDFETHLEVIETIAHRSIENTKLDDISEKHRQFLIERARGIVAVAFRNVRQAKTGGPN